MSEKLYFASITISDGEVVSVGINQGITEIRLYSITDGDLESSGAIWRLEADDEEEQTKEASISTEDAGDTDDEA